MISVLCFKIASSHFAVDSHSVLEVVEFPAVSGWPGAPSSVLGVVDYRGEVIPVVDVSLRLGGVRQTPGHQHQLLVVRSHSGNLALLVEVAEELRTLDGLQSEAKAAPQALKKAHRFLQSVARADGKVVLLLDLDAVADFGTDAELPASEETSSSVTDPVLIARAEALARVEETAKQDNTTRVVLVRLGGERLGIEVDSVAGLMPCPAITPVPGTPEHFLGLGYHRGELLRVLDVRSHCGLKVDGADLAQVVILQGDGMATGLAVELIEAVVRVQRRGAKVAYQDGWLTILDLEDLPLSTVVSHD